MPTKCRSVEEAAELVLLGGANIEIEIPSYLTIEQFRSQFIRMMKHLTNTVYEVKDAQCESGNVVYIKKG
mgnify:FL=1